MLYGQRYSIFPKDLPFPLVGTRDRVIPPSVSVPLMPNITYVRSSHAEINEKVVQFLQDALSHFSDNEKTV